MGASQTKVWLEYQIAFVNNIIIVICILAFVAKFGIYA